MKSTSFWNPESTVLESGIRNPVPGIRNPQHGIQNPRLSWIPLHGANSTKFYYTVDTVVSRGPVSRKSRKLFGPGNSCFTFAVFAFNIKDSIILKMIQWNYQLRTWLIVRNYSTGFDFKILPSARKIFRPFEKQTPGTENHQKKHTHKHISLAKIMWITSSHVITFLDLFFSILLLVSDCFHKFSDEQSIIFTGWELAEGVS